MVHRLSPVRLHWQVTPGAGGRPREVAGEAFHALLGMGQRLGLGWHTTPGLAVLLHRLRLILLVAVDNIRVGGRKRADRHVRRGRQLLDVELEFVDDTAFDGADRRTVLRGERGHDACDQESDRDRLNPARWAHGFFLRLVSEC